MKQAFIDRLLKAAQRRMWTETLDPYGFNPCDFSGGNYDDAYSGGVADGETELAREVLTQLEVAFKIPKEEE
jgi:hypothetical protein